MVTQPPSSKDHTQTGTTSGSRWGFVLGSTLIIVAWFVGSMAIAQNLPVPALLTVGILSFIGVFPLTFIAYWVLRAEAKRERLEADLLLLGLADEKDVSYTAETLFKVAYNPVQFWIYLILIMALSSLVVAGYLGRAQLGFMDAAVMNLVFYGYLGAYVFSIQQIVRRFSTFDLQPQVYASILVRMTMAVVITFVGAAVITAAGGQVVDKQDWVVVVAFVIGVFPNRGIRWFIDQTNRVFNSPLDRTNDRPINYLLGISQWHAERLSEIGVDDAQNLATADMRKLLLTTQFDAQEIANWIDQAILYMKVGDKLTRFHDAKITTFHEFRLALLQLGPGAATTSVQAGDRLKSRETLAALLGMSGPDELDRLAVVSDFPNYAHIAEYYRRIGELARRRAALGMQSLVGAIRETNYEAAIEDGQRMLDLDPEHPDPAVLQSMGAAYYQLGDSAKALEYYTRALEIDDRLAEAYYSRSLIYSEQGKYDEAIRDCTLAININRTYANAFQNRGVAYIYKNYPDRAIADFTEALELNPRKADAYFNRGFAYYVQGEFARSVDDFEKAYLLDERDPTLWFVWGESLLRIADVQVDAEEKNVGYARAIEKLSVGVMQDDDKLAAKAYADRGYIYLQMGAAFYSQSGLDLRAAISKDPNLTLAYTNLGLLEARQGNYEAAVAHYQAALSRAPEHILTLYNLAKAYIELNRTDEARTQFEKIVRLAPADSVDATDARAWLIAHPA